MAKTKLKNVNPAHFRRVPGYEDIYAIKTVCDGSHICTECLKPISKGHVIWFCDGIYLESGKDGRWHDKCLGE